MRCKSLPVLVLFSSLMMPAVAAATTVETIVDQVSQAQYTDYLNNSLYTHSGDNRWCKGGAEHDLARTSIYNTFQSFGLDTTLEAFTYTDTDYSATHYNVVATLPGKVHPDQVYVIGAHYDSYSNNCWLPGGSAPGADDDASGVAAVLEAARVLSQYQFDATLVFIAFDVEEMHLVGSKAYASQHAGDNIRGMIQLDGIAYNPTGSHYNEANVVYPKTSSPQSIAVAQELAASISTYGGLTPFIWSEDRSDHVSFDAFGAAGMAERYYGEHNPNYHLPTDSVDTPGYIDYVYATSMTRGAVGYLATNAVPLPEPGSVLMLVIGAIGLAGYAFVARAR